MKDEDRLLRYLDLCRRIQLRLIQEGNWPWPGEPDSPDGPDMVGSRDNPKQS